MHMVGTITAVQLGLTVAIGCTDVSWLLSFSDFFNKIDVGKTLARWIEWIWCISFVQIILLELWDHFLRGENEWYFHVHTGGAGFCASGKYWLTQKYELWPLPLISFACLPRRDVCVLLYILFWWLNSWPCKSFAWLVLHESYHFRRLEVCYGRLQSQQFLVIVSE